MHREDIRQQLLQANKEGYFVYLTLKDDDGNEEKLDAICWIESVGRTRFTFKPSAVHVYDAPIARVVAVERALPDLEGKLAFLKE